MQGSYNPDARYYSEIKPLLDLLPLPNQARILVAQYMHWTVWDKHAPAFRNYVPPHRLVTVVIDGVPTEVKVWLNNES